MPSITRRFRKSLNKCPIFENWLKFKSTGSLCLNAHMFFPRLLGPSLSTFLKTLVAK